MISGIGVGAGYDKTGILVDILAKNGANFVEVGTVTPRPQDVKNDARLELDWKSRTSKNSLGMPSPGYEIVVKNIQNRSSNIPILLSVASNRNNNDIKFLGQMIDKSPCIAGVINPSSPNAPMKISIQDLSDVAGTVNKPVWLKISERIKVPQSFAGVITTNSNPGGVAGEPLKQHAIDLLKYYVGESVPVISVGGVMSRDDAVERIDIGAVAVEVVTAIYLYGPQWFSNLGEF